MTQEQLAKVFTEWKARYDADPEAFQSHEAFVSDEPLTYGESAARYFLWLSAELSKGE